MRAECSVDECSNRIVARGWCDTHYRRWARKGSPQAGRVSTLDRFMTHVAKAEPEDCWLWTGTKNHAGYGSFSVGRARRLGAHRWSYEHFVGAVPAGLELDHLCRVRHCVNPAHLEPVTRQENLRRGVRTEHMSMRTHCPRGHAYDEANTGWYKATRYCRACKVMQNRKQRAKVLARNTL